MKIIPHPTRRHLGDLINILQKYKAEEICTKGSCSCCGNCVYDTVNQLFNLMNFNMKVSDNENDAQIVFPTWSNSMYYHDKSPYKKPYNLIKKNIFMTYQFDARSNKKKELSLDNKKKFELTFKDSIDIGEKSNISIIEKFNLISSSFIYVGIDSGITHLAMMTYTPVYVIHNKNMSPKRFYPDTNQIEFFDNIKFLINKIKSLRIKL